MTDGVITQINGNILRVTIQCRSACAACALKSGCGMSEQTEKTVSVPVDDASLYGLGQKVSLSVSPAGIALSLFLAYVLPLLCMLSVLIVTAAWEWAETLSALCSLGILVPYYVGLHFVQLRLHKKVKITIAR